MRATIVGLLLLACGGPAGECPARPEPVSGGFRCIENGCQMPSLNFSALDCTANAPLTRDESCTYAASYRCGNGINLTVVYRDGRAFFAAEGQDCLTSYVLAGQDDPFDCE